MYIFPNFEPVHCSMSGFNCCLSKPAYRFLRRQVRCSGIPISLRIFHSLLWPGEREKVPCSPPLGQNVHPLDSALRTGRAEAQSPRCRGHKLEGPLDTVCCGQIGKPGLKQPYQAHSHFTQDDDSWCFSAPSLSPLTEFYCFTLEDYKWGGVLRTYLSLRAWIFPSSVETCPFIIRRGKLLYPRLINYVLRLHVQCEYFIFVVRAYSLMHETLLCITYAE